MKITIIDFGAGFCAPCRNLKPIFHKLAAEYQDTIETMEVDIEKQIDLAMKYQVRHIPCIVVLKDGQEVERKVGFDGPGPVEDLFRKYA